MDTNRTGCPLAPGAMCLVCCTAEGVRVKVLGSPYGPLCVTLCPAHSGPGVHLRLTADAGRRLALEHRAHTGER